MERPEHFKNALANQGGSRISIIIKIDRHLRGTAMSATRFGRLAVNDPRLVHDLRRGREPGPDIVARIEAFIAGAGA